MQALLRVSSSRSAADSDEWHLYDCSSNPSLPRVDGCSICTVTLPENLAVGVRIITATADDQGISPANQQQPMLALAGTNRDNAKVSTKGLHMYRPQAHKCFAHLKFSRTEKWNISCWHNTSVPMADMHSIFQVSNLGLGEMETGNSGPRAFSWNATLGRALVNPDLHT